MALILLNNPEVEVVEHTPGDGLRMMGQALAEGHDVVIKRI